MNFQINFFFSGTGFCNVNILTGKWLAQMYKSDPIEILEQLKKKLAMHPFFKPTIFFSLSKSTCFNLFVYEMEL